MSAPNFVADFDSASAMTRALASSLHGRDFPKLGMDQGLSPLIPIANLLPEWVRDQIYIWSGWGEAVPPEQLPKIDLYDVNEYVTGEYPERQYKAVAVGSSNGAAVHLLSALGVPWLGQTWLVPVQRSGVHPDEPADDLEWGRQPGRDLLDANPSWQLHHMHDPNQDRLMVQRMTYFRVKQRELGPHYRRFLKERLEPGGTILVIECQRRWPVMNVGERHYFQPGAMGGATPEEYLEGSERVADYLRRYGSHRRDWKHGEPDGEQPEAEWGFEPALHDDIEQFADKHGFRVRRIVFTEPEDLSRPVADLHRWWLRDRGLPANRLIGESFILMEPYWVLRTGSVPWWGLFSVEESARRLEAYLGQEEYDEVMLMLFPHGIEGVGFAPVERWRKVLNLARRRGGFIGLDADEYPKDFAGLVRYHDDLKEKVRERHPLPTPLTLEEFDDWLARAVGRYEMRVEEGAAVAS
jgi:hypothetical protein